MSSKICLLAVAVLGVFGGTVAAAEPAARVVHMDGEGVLRWADTNEEVVLFGVNYYAPHVMNYSDLKRLGASIPEVIDQDLAHLVRMGLDALRLHVFDREISDREGQLIANEHLDLLDYLIAHAKARGIYTVLTPIAWWNTPNPNDGFSNHHTMPEMTMSAEARRAQCTYLRQFLEHVNPLTGLAIKDDPAVPVIELINEPLYAPEVTDAQVVEYINALAAAVRSTGCAKPIFYNGWCGRLAAVGQANVEGCTFGWYPTGLVAGHSLRGDYLPRVDDYPEMRHEALAHKAKIVYEFDAADVPGGYLYAAMARSFRQGGAQIATQFQYDPLPVAPFNEGWVTHYLNLVYAPHRALGFMVAAEAFRNVPRLATFGTYPENARFGACHVSYEEDLAEYVGEEAFVYANTTKTAPPAPDRLRRVAGCGSSPIVAYEGTGAYFLDRLAPGVWRLEVYPDSVWVADPFSPPTSLQHEVARAVWREWKMTITLPDLGPTFVVEPLNASNTHRAEAQEGRFPVRPGAYGVHRRADAIDWEAFASAGRLGLREFVAPPDRPGVAVVRHTPVPLAIEGQSMRVQAIAIGVPPDREAPMKLYARWPGAEVFEALSMTQVRPYEYTVEIPAERVKAGSLAYAIAVGDGQQPTVFPFGQAGAPDEEGFGRPFTRSVFSQDSDTPSEVGGVAGARAEIVQGSQAEAKALRLLAPGFAEKASAGLQIAVRTPEAGTMAPSDTAWMLVVRARAVEPATTAFEVGLIEAEGGAAYGTNVPVGIEWGDYRVPVASLRPLWNTPGGELDVARLARVSFVFGAWLYGAARGEAHGVDIESVRLESIPPYWLVDIVTRDAPALLFEAGRHTIHARGQVQCQQALVGGATLDHPALRIAVKAFEAPPSALSFSNDVTEEVACRGDFLATCDTLEVCAWGSEPYVDALEVVLIERDGSPWGANVPISGAREPARIPLEQLRFFSHWPSHPAERGGPGDCFHPERVAAVQLCFGSWLYPRHVGEPCTVTIDHVAITRQATN